MTYYEFEAGERCGHHHRTPLGVMHCRLARQVAAEWWRIGDGQRNGESQAAFVARSIRDHIVEVRRDADDAHKKKANARLIAAAPDLLAAAEDALAFCEEQCELAGIGKLSDDIAEGRLGIHLRAAIVKAKGG